MILRDKSKITKMLILLELLRGRGKLKEIAEAIDITVQGASEYLKVLESEGLVKNWKITPHGWEYLDSALEELGDFVHDANKIMKRKKIAEAIAGEKIKKGDRVGLFLENGYLHAYHRESSSVGIAINDAEIGEDVGVSNLRGIVDIKFGKITAVLMPPVEEGGSRAIDIQRIRDFTKSNIGKKIGVCGVVAHVALKGLPVDFEFSSANAAVEAAYRGFDTILFISREMMPYTLRILEESGVNFEVFNAKNL